MAFPPLVQCPKRNKLSIYDMLHIICSMPHFLYHLTQINMHLGSHCMPISISHWQHAFYWNFDGVFGMLFDFKTTMSQNLSTPIDFTVILTNTDSHDRAFSWKLRIVYHCWSVLNLVHIYTDLFCSSIPVGISNNFNKSSE